MARPSFVMDSTAMAWLGMVVYSASVLQTKIDPDGGRVDFMGRQTQCQRRHTAGMTASTIIDYSNYLSTCTNTSAAFIREGRAASITRNEDRTSLRVFSGIFSEYRLSIKYPTLSLMLLILDNIP